MQSSSKNIIYFSSAKDRRNRIMATTERKKLNRRYNQLRTSGLRDVKFYLGEVAGITIEQVCAEVNRVFDIVDRGEAFESEDWGHSYN